MSKRGKPVRKPVPSAEVMARARRALNEGRSQQALELAKQLYKDEATPAHKDLLRTAYLERARQLRKQGYTRDAAAVLDNALHLGDGDPGWLAKVAEEFAAAGETNRALAFLERITDTALRARILNQSVDTAMGKGAAGRALLPESLRAQFDLVLRAFAQAEAGQDDQARESLQGVGLASPFLEWKLLLRGLLAYYQRDDERALENWQRLSPERLPARLAAPLRFRIDAAYRTAQPVGTQTALQKQADALETSTAVRLLRALQANLVNEEQLPQAFRQAEHLLPTLRQEAPQLVPRLASCFYWTIVTHGQPEDMTRYRRVFGEPAEDPHFDRLQALVHEHIGRLQDAHQHWQRFEEWVATHPPGWPASQVDHVRALVWERMGHNAAGIPDIEEMDRLPAFLRDHPARPKSLHPPAEKCFARSLELAPHRLQGYETLLHFYQEKKQDKKAEKVARRLLERFPDHVPTLVALSDLRMQGQGYAEALTLAQQALKLNPLDRPLRIKVNTARLFNARSHAEAGRFDEARAEYQTALALAEDQNKGPILCKWAACEFKAGDAARAEELLQRAAQETGNRLAVAFSMLIETIRLKLPRPLKQRFDKDFNAGLAEAATAAAAVALAEMAASHHLAGVTYVGQKTHEKKVLSYIEKASGLEFTEDQLERLCSSLLGLGSVKVARKFTALGRERFPKNPYFPFFEAMSYMASGPDRCPVWKVQPLLQAARELAGQLPADPRQKKLLADIQEREGMLRSLNPMAMGMIEDLFDRLYDMDDYDDDFDDEDDWDDDFDSFDDDGPEELPYIPFGGPPKKKKKRRRR